MWKLLLRLMAPAGADGGAGGGSGDPGAGGAGGAGGGAGQPGGSGDATLLSSGGKPGGSDGKDAGKSGAGGEGWLWNEGVPATGERPGWYKADKYKSVAEQAAALPGLEAKLGPAAAFFGSPADGVYKMPAMPAGVTGEWDIESPLTKSFLEFAKTEGLSQAGVDKLATFYAKAMGAEVQAGEASLAEAIGKLGENVGARIEAVKTYVTSKVGAEGFAALDEALGTNVAAFKAFEQLIGGVANDPRLASGGGTTSLGFTRADIEREQFKTYDDGPNKGQRVYEVDTEHRKKVDDMWRKLFPGEGHQFMGGA